MVALISIYCLPDVPSIDPRPAMNRAASRATLAGNVARGAPPDCRPRSRFGRRQRRLLGHFFDTEQVFVQPDLQPNGEEMWRNLGHATDDPLEFLIRRSTLGGSDATGAKSWTVFKTASLARRPKNPRCIGNVLPSADAIILPNGCQMGVKPPKRPPLSRTAVRKLNLILR